MPAGENFFIILRFRIVERTYYRLLDLKDNFKETFLEMTKRDPLHPLLSDQQLFDMTSSFQIASSRVQSCIQERGIDAVLIKDEIHTQPSR